MIILLDPAEWVVLWLGKARYIMMMLFELRSEFGVDIYGQFRLIYCRLYICCISKIVIVGWADIKLLLDGI